ncbi:MAG: hypothetical protein WDO74_01910 [Pseudomonadota bacterium]
MWTADHLNAALPTLSELNGAIARLGQCGLVIRTEDGLSVAESVREFHTRWMHEPARKLVSRFEEFLRRRCVEGEILVQAFTAAELASAQDQYSRGHSEARRKLSSAKGKHGAG